MMLYTYVVVYTTMSTLDHALCMPVNYTITFMVVFSTLDVIT